MRVARKGSIEDGAEWKPVANAGEYGVAKDALNTVRFEAVKTRAIRVEVQLQEGFSGGVLQLSAD